MRGLITRLVLSLAVASVVALGSVQLWHALNAQNDEQLARIAEIESYAARSQLVRNVERVLTALEGVKAYWITNGRLPREQWASDQDIKMAAIPGLKAMVWDDPENNVRIAGTVKNQEFDFRPDLKERESLNSLVARAQEVSTDTMSGPFIDQNGRPFFEVYLVSKGSGNGSRLAVVIDAKNCLKNLLMDESPGYAVRVVWGDTTLFERGEPAKNIPVNWSHEGYIKPTLTALWKVTHSPTQRLVDSHKNPSIDMTLLLGLIIAVLMAALMFENWRVQTRARVAEKAERLLAQSNLNLEREIANRTLELRKRTADLQTITDSVGHDLRNPLNTISMNIQLFEARNEAALSSEELAPLKRIQPAIRQMAEILDRLLGLSSVAHTTFKRESLDMCRLVEEAFGELMVNEQPPEVSLEVAMLPNVEADKVMVKMLLMNLLSNALKYTRNKKERHIKVDFEVKNGVTIYSISDNGIGFDQRSAKHMFKAFQRLEQSRAETGIGLGLTIVARIVGRHGGKIWAEGEPGERASFCFTLEPME